RIPDSEANAHASAALTAGDLKFELEGEKLRGSWALVKMKGRQANAWLLIKHNDDFASRERDITADRKESIVSGALLPRHRAESTALRRRHDVLRAQRRGSVMRPLVRSFVARTRTMSTRPLAPLTNTKELATLRPLRPIPHPEHPAPPVPKPGPHPGPPPSRD